MTSTESRQDDRGRSYAVLVCDLAHMYDADGTTLVSGFSERELAVEYARRRTWSSVEEMKAPSASAEEIRRRWSAFGEACRVIGPGGSIVYDARDELDAFVATPLPPDRSDWTKLRPAADREDP